MKKIFRLVLGLLLLIVIITASQYHNDIPVEELLPKYANEHSKFIEVQGMKVHCRIEGSGENLVLIHGTSSSLHTWEGWTQELKDRYRIIRMDLPGKGLTGPNPSNQYDDAAYVSFLEDFFKAIGIDTFYLAGNSLGGSIAWNYALKHPDQVKKLILLDASGYPMNKVPPTFKLARSPGFSLIMRKVTPKFIIRKSLMDVYGDDSKVTESQVQRYFDLTLREGNREALNIRLNTTYWPHPEKIKEITTPTLILWGEMDKWIPLEHAKNYERDISGSKLIVYPGVGHVPMEEIPEQSAKDADKFLRSL